MTHSIDDAIRGISGAGGRTGSSNFTVGINDGSGGNTGGLGISGI